MTTHEVQYDDRIPIPIGNRAIVGELAMLRNAILACPVNQSFVWRGKNKTLYKAAKDVGCRITVRQIDDESYRIWKRIRE